MAKLADVIADTNAKVTDIQAKLNAGTGGGAPTDLTPVLDAVAGVKTDTAKIVDELTPTPPPAA